MCAVVLSYNVGGTTLARKGLSKEAIHMHDEINITWEPEAIKQMAGITEQVKADQMERRLAVFVTAGEGNLHIALTETEDSKPAHLVIFLSDEDPLNPVNIALED